ncbi:rhodanese-like domain-containing protein [Deinococcus cellulosilyticus]|uniref:Rhodanese domain-containing protein n=1 Tax=Deinococcus cellulosilyticus (strain DSM 18568 / NBRC 106333 / KACC 11606 / 5516J-15) TaxID=1223518 RepID=A0A511N1N2_DEIC1|nr:rhodanese-like domain-containing protein [Deinococcus cellulosilyticus]GEM46755.1 hypothetical protein DC3_23900 [Deinococcus cellulosilyticus NBRC 106333 = KACC 11606]
MTQKIEPDELQHLQTQHNQPLIVDVRSEEEYLAGHVPGAIHIPLADLASRIGDLPQQTIVPYCNMFHPGSSRGEQARDLLQSHGLDARVLEGGFQGWKKAGLPVEEEL